LRIENKYLPKCIWEPAGDGVFVHFKTPALQLLHPILSTMD
jgi:hypothetical protein